ncbi:efflux transporter periplasmic adaptor subunit [Sphingomonas ginsenosidimutans]|jgi:membrane fusion protein (multidrug efflux system)|uniref:Efflux transporter periplasmic adaptor subunit n=1 Tax=Sphingomonas ginsenosidimutans TaxID=862134 RepID=A0A2A4I2H9_9SPHN|nr:efflux RND transporter periplasmic adaptor subunit [Sphingomonas ginsenosidimutans]PCG10135.1 efflux transporter periplasmic adaptor subunit [Sphingomonas ginsenosidimutans]
MTYKGCAVAALLFLPLAACGGGKDAAQQQQQAQAGPPQVGVVTVQPQSVTLTTTLPGRLTAYETSEVRPQVSGLITARLFREGDQVSKGQALYRIDPQPYVTQVANARAALARARAAIASTSALQRRYGELVKINAISRQDYDNALTQAQQAQADVAAQSAALRSAQIDLARTTVRAPISGRIGRSVATTGALATAGQANALTTIQRLDPIYVDVPQSAADLLKLRQKIAAGDLSRGGGAARVRLRLDDGSVYPIEGTLQFADVSVDPATGTQTIRALFPNPRALLLPGMYVRAELVEGTQANAMLVPQRAVSRDEKGNAVAMIVGPDGKVQPRPLTTSRTIGDDWLVTGGLKPGDKVIVEGGMMLRPGMPVKAVPYNPNAAPAQGQGQPGQGQPAAQAK